MRSTNEPPLETAFPLGASLGSRHRSSPDGGLKALKAGRVTNARQSSQTGSLAKGLGPRTAQSCNGGSAAAQHAAAAAAFPAGALRAAPAMGQLQLGTTATGPGSAEAAPRPGPDSGGLLPAHMRRSDDMVAAWQSRPRVPHRYQDLHVNYMVLGECGLGKTTFIQNLISSFQVAQQPASTSDGSATTLSQFQADPGSLKTVLEPMDIPESSRRLMISIQDMPGWGEDVNLRRYVRTVTSFLLAQRVKDYELLAHARSVPEEAMCGQLQNGITACLYFLPPHRVKKIDLILMAAISQLVTVIPILSKADTMTEAELAQYRGELRQLLAHPAKHFSSSSRQQQQQWQGSSRSGGDHTRGPGSPRVAGAGLLQLRLFDITPEVQADLGLGELPLAVMCSGQQEPCTDAALLSLVGPDGLTDPQQPVRGYAWGTAYPFHAGHQSDLIALKRLLLGDLVDSLYGLVGDSYARHLAFCEEYEEADGELGVLLAEASFPGRLLEYDGYHAVKERLSQTNASIRRLRAANAQLEARIQEALRVAKDARDRRWR